MSQKQFSSSMQNTIAIYTYIKNKDLEYF